MYAARRRFVLGIYSSYASFDESPMHCLTAWGTACSGGSGESAGQERRIAACLDSSSSP